MARPLATTSEREFCPYCKREHDEYECRALIDVFQNDPHVFATVVRSFYTKSYCDLRWPSRKLRSYRDDGLWLFCDVLYEFHFVFTKHKRIVVYKEIRTMKSHVQIDLDLGFSESVSLVMKFEDVDIHGGIFGFVQLKSVALHNSGGYYHGDENIVAILGDEFVSFKK